VNLTHYLGLLHQAERNLGGGFREVGDAHGDEPDVSAIARRLAGQCDAHAEVVEPFVGRYGEDADSGPDRLYSMQFNGTRSGGLGLLRDLHDLYLMATECDLSWTLVGQAAQGLRDADLLAVVRRCEGETVIQLNWLRTRMKEAAPQALVVT